MSHSLHATWLQISLNRLETVERQNSGEAALAPEHRVPAKGSYYS
jgi:hypothetical protein